MANGNNISSPTANNWLKLHARERWVKHSRAFPTPVLPGGSAFSGKFPEIAREYDDWQKQQSKTKLSNEQVSIARLRQQYVNEGLTA